MTQVPVFGAAAVVASLLGVAACSTLMPVSGAQRAFQLIGADGGAVGDVTVSGNGAGTKLTVRATGMPPGTHGIHLHEKGLCEGPKFTTAGGHWNPAGKKHGHANPAGPHLGDLPNLDIAGSGRGRASVSIANGANMVADADGTALVIHAGPDDYRTDPSGNSGDRIACAVIAAPR